MINITSDFESILNSLRNRAATLKQDYEEIKDETSANSGSDFIKSVILDRKAMLDNQIKRLHKNFYDDRHHNLVMLTDEELDRLCNG